MADVVPLSEPDNYSNAWEFVIHLPPEMVTCRGGRNHNFIDGEQLHGDVSNGVVHTETACARGCGVVKVEDWLEARGYYVKNPHYRYPKDYLIKETEHGTIDRADVSAAFRVVKYNEKRGIPTSGKPPRSPRKRRRSA